MKKILGLLFVISTVICSAQQHMGGSFVFDKAIIVQNVATTFTATGTFTLTTSQVQRGLLIPATSTVATTMVLPTATQLANDLEMQQGSYIDFFILNNQSSNGTVTLSVGSGITASGFPGTNTLTLASSTTVGVAGFRLTFLSTTAATLTRIN